MLRAVLFDLDNTLITWDAVDAWENYQFPRLQRVFEYVTSTLYPLEGVDAAAFVAAYGYQLEAAWEEGIRTLCAPNTRQVMTDTLAGFGVPSDRMQIETVLDVYDWQPPAGLRVFPDVVEVLPQIRNEGIELGIITNASHPMTLRDRELAALDLIDLFPTCRLSAGDVGVLKPHPAIFEDALRRLGISASKAVFVGDSLKADVRGAQGAGIRAVWRSPSPELPADQQDIVPDGTITTLFDLLPLLDAWYPGWRNGHTP